MTDLEKAARQALEWIEANGRYQNSKVVAASLRQALESRSDDEQPAQEPVPVKDNTYGYAKSLAEAIFKQHFASDEHYASGRIVWGVNDTVIGILTQIDNMVADMVRRPAQQEPVAYSYTSRITGAQGFSHHPMPRFVDPESWDITPLHTRPQAREPLTDEQISAIVREAAKGSAIRRDGSTSHRIARAIEAKLKEKNT